MAFRHQERSFRSDATVLADYALTTTTTTRGGGENGERGREERRGEERGEEGGGERREPAPIGIFESRRLWVCIAN